jgi:hypothetical protein
MNQTASGCQRLTLSSGLATVSALITGFVEDMSVEVEACG